MAEKRYREFVFDGIGGHRIWDDVNAQSILGEEKFADGLIDFNRFYKGA